MTSTVPPARAALRLGTAGWAIPRAHAAAFPPEGSGLERYAARFAAAEINSSFHRPHRPATYAGWAASVPEDFRFAAKLPKAVTHERRLLDPAEPLERFLGEAAGLGRKLGILLVQLPPSLAFEAGTAEAFFRLLRDRMTDSATAPAKIACEPRHPSWFTPEAEALLRGHRVARVAADPAPVPEAGQPGGWPGLIYHRLHGSPVIYRSAYGPAFLDGLAARLPAAGTETWCIFDNTASGAAAGDALDLQARASGG